tara:strand:+ start:241 stop:633 length:393 start_codon:yes stop_codon:yes gene_type:complete
MKKFIYFILILILIFKIRKKTYYGIDRKIGRGVFCHNFILPGEIIEISPILHIEKTSDVELNKYLFKYQTNSVIGLGIASMFNHSDNPNILWDYNKIGDIVFISNKLILPGQQLFINYGKRYWKNRKDKI